MVSKWFHFHVSFHVHLETWEPISKVEIHIVEHFKHEALARETGQPLLMLSTAIWIGSSLQGRFEIAAKSRLKSQQKSPV